MSSFLDDFEFQNPEQSSFELGDDVTTWNDSEQLPIAGINGTSIFQSPEPLNDFSIPDDSDRVYTYLPESQIENQTSSLFSDTVPELHSIGNSQNQNPLEITLYNSTYNDYDLHSNYAASSSTQDVTAFDHTFNTSVSANSSTSTFQNSNCRNKAISSTSNSTVELHNQISSVADNDVNPALYDIGIQMTDQSLNYSQNLSRMNSTVNASNELNALNGFAIPNEHSSFSLSSRSSSLDETSLLASPSQSETFSDSYNQITDFTETIVGLQEVHSAVNATASGQLFLASQDQEAIGFTLNQELVENSDISLSQAAAMIVANRGQDLNNSIRERRFGTGQNMLTVDAAPYTDHTYFTNNSLSSTSMTPSQSSTLISPSMMPPAMVNSISTNIASSSIGSPRSAISTSRSCSITSSMSSSSTSSVGSTFNTTFPSSSSSTRRPRKSVSPSDTNKTSPKPRVKKLSSGSKGKKGDTITLRCPAFAVGNEAAGSFGFINLRNPGAWTRIKHSAATNPDDSTTTTKKSKKKRKPSKK